MRVAKMVRIGAYSLFRGAWVWKTAFCSVRRGSHEFTIPQYGKDLPIKQAHIRPKWGKRRMKTILHQFRNKHARHRTPRPDKSYLAPNRGAYTRCAHTQKSHNTRTLLILTTLKNRTWEHRCALGRREQRLERITRSAC